MKFHVISAYKRDFRVYNNTLYSCDSDIFDKDKDKDKDKDFTFNS